MNKSATSSAAAPELEDFEADCAEVSQALCATAGVIAPSRDQLQRLMLAVEEVPLRFAPFFSRTAALFDLGEAKIEALFSEFDSATAWVDSGVAGVAQFNVTVGKSLAEPQSYFLRCAPRAYLPMHRHLGAESVLVLEGSYVDDQGARRVAGEVHNMPTGTTHALTVSELGCTIAVRTQGIEFVGGKRPA